MIELGRVQELMVVREKNFGVYATVLQYELASGGLS